MDAKHLKLTRREFLWASTMTAAGVMTVSCTPAEAPAAAATATPAAAAPPPAEGAAPSQYSEAPMLAEMVQAGALPPVEERLPVEPRVVPVVEGVGVYSDRLNIVSYGTFGDWGHVMFDGLFGEYNDNSMFADAMQSVEVSEDSKEYTFHIREGLKWSDGTPVTTKDVQFWYEDDALNEEISPTTPGFGYTVAGEFCKLDVIDDFSYKLSWSVPNPSFIRTLPYWAGMPFASFAGTPAHYLQKYHIKYNPDVATEAKNEGFDNWVAYYGARKNSWSGQYAAETPALHPFLLKETQPTHHLYVRNPYYWGVDSAGNQLPYFDEVLEQIVNDKETYNLKIVAGEADYAAFSTKIKDMPLYQDSAESSNYEVRRFKSIRGSDESFSFNRTCKDTALAAIFNDPRWSQAMSYAINRDEINEVVFLGTGEARQAAPNPEVSFYDPEWATFCADYNPDMANQLLDEMGLDQRDADNWRLRPDGEQLAILIEYTTNIDSPIEDVLPLVVDHWQAVGVKVDYKAIERDLLFARGSTNELQLGVWHTDRTNETRLFVPQVAKLVPDYIGGENPATNEWTRWHLTDGKEGLEPPAEWQEHFKDIDDWHKTSDEAEYKRLGAKIIDFEIKDQLRLIGTVGFSAWPVIVKRDMHNIPTEGYMGDDVGFARSLMTTTWYRQA
ncbi:MAG: ABC transporter substrate-binding protein [Caldilineaceae bacterium]